MATMPSRPSPRLDRLPTELISRIFEYSHFSDHLNISITCRRLAECSKPILERHQIAHRENSVVSDLEPSTIPLLVRKITQDPFVAWNVRSIEIWGTRYEWSHWRPFDVKGPESLPEGESELYRWSDAFQRTTPLGWAMPHEELSGYLELLKLHGHLTPRELEKTRTELLSGVDSVYKILLILLCPRLNRFKLVHTQDFGVMSSINSMLKWLSRIIVKSWRQASWAPGLASLREMIIGAKSGTWLDGKWMTSLYPSKVYRSIMMLPSFKSVYLWEADISHDFEPDLINELDEVPLECLLGGSSVEHIFLDNFSAEDHHVLIESVLLFIQIPRALKTLTIRDGFCYGGAKLHHQAMFATMIHLGKSLESLIIYDDNEHQSLDAWRFYTGGPMALLSTHLTKISINITDITSKKRVTPGGGNASIRDLWRDSDPMEHDSCFFYIEQSFPKSLEVLLLSNRQPHKGTLDMTIVEELFIHLIENERCPRLKAIYIQEHPKWSRWYRKYRFSKLAEVGWNHGIDVHVRGNSNRPRYQVEFPQAPILETINQLEPQDGSDGKAFDPFIGHWTMEEDDHEDQEDEDEEEEEEGENQSEEEEDEEEN